MPRAPPGTAPRLNPNFSKDHQHDQAGAAAPAFGVAGSPVAAAAAVPLTDHPPLVAPYPGAAPKSQTPAAISRTERDIVALGIIFAAIILFIGTGSSVLTRLARHLLFGETNVDSLLTNALLLNIALIVFGWRRYTDLIREVAARRDAEAAALRLALIDAQDWAAHLTLAINISPVQLRDSWFAQRLLKLLVEAHIPPSRIEIEITEISLRENLPMVRSLITSLRNQGVRISLDDFGHGASSLAHLRTLPFDRIKIDRNFIAGLGHNRDSSAVVEAIAAIGRGMDMPITAEGIETPEILAELLKIGALQGQGYLYGRPMNAETLREELADQRLLAPATATAAPEDRRTA
eukprot:gene9129-9210_t